MKNHMFDMAFTVVSEHEWEEVTAEELLAGIERRLQALKEHPEEVMGACGYSDSFEEGDDPEQR